MGKTGTWIVLGLIGVGLLFLLLRKSATPPTQTPQPSFWQTLAGLGTASANLATTIVQGGRPKGGNRVEPGAVDTGGASPGIVDLTHEGHTITYGDDPAADGPLFGLFG